MRTIYRNLLCAVSAVSILSCGVSAEDDISAACCLPIIKTAAERERPSLYVCGTPFGIKLLTDGVMVTGFSKIGNSNDIFELSPAGKAGIEKGDVITKVNGVKITSSGKMSELIASAGQAAELTYKRDNEEYKATVEIKTDSDGVKRIGLWVRDSTAGIGTMTFYDEMSGRCAGLGHAVCDIDTGEILPLGSGETVPAVITSVRKGQNDSPGELCGTLTAGKKSGIITDNCSCGLYAALDILPDKANEYPLGFSDEVQCGSAYIISTVGSDGPRRYSVEIESTDSHNKDNKNLVIRVTDKELIEKTGGIVQGMSGSPIIQNGRLIGAVTHVFV
ncbi:MAG: SpoIVB peptidase S55 domain-containing protein, partial [Ruminiclostridium sp.]